MHFHKSKNARRIWSSQFLKIVLDRLLLPHVFNFQVFGVVFWVGLIADGLKSIAKSPFNVDDRKQNCIFSTFLTVYFRGPFTFWDFLTFDFDTKSSTYSRSKCELFSRLSIFTQYRPLSTRPYIFDLLSVNPGSKIQSRNHKAFVETKSKAIHSKYWPYFCVLDFVSRHHAGSRSHKMANWFQDWFSILDFVSNSIMLTNLIF